MKSFTTAEKQRTGRAVANLVSRREDRTSSGPADDRPQAIAQRKLQEQADGSSRVSQLRSLEERLNGVPGNQEVAAAQMKADAAVQRMDLDEEDLQMKSADAVQQMDLDEEELQMRTDPTVQRMDMDDEDYLQGKFKPVQRETYDEEEPFQAKSDSVQRMDEEDYLQGKFEPVQRQGDAVATSGAPTGMPAALQSGLEQLSGRDLSGVRVHYNSPEPTQLNALAYTQGQDIHVGPGQEKHLPHEGWHAVQQMEGRVQPTTQAYGVEINDDRGLEREADVMGDKAARMPLPKIGEE